VEEVKEVIADMNGRAPVAVVCEILGVARSSYYASVRGEKVPAKRGPKTEVSDERLTEAIREVIEESPFYGEGYRKVWARLRFGRHRMRVGKRRVLRLMRLHGLLAPVRRVHKRGRRAHDGKIVTEVPNEMWGADATKFWTEENGWCWFFGVVDHFNSECVGWTVEEVGDRWAAMESLRCGVRRVFGSFGKDVARGVRLRHDWGSQYTARDFQADLRFAGLESTPAYVGEPECNGVVERFIRTLKEQCIWVHRFRDIEEAREIIGEFIERYNEGWILERLGYRTPVQARVDYYRECMEAA